MYDNTDSGIDGKREFLERNWDIVRDNVEFTREVSPEDFKAMEVLRWLQKQNDFPTTLGYYVELARKFLSEAKPKAARFLLDEQLANNLSEQDQRLVEEKVIESRHVIPDEGTMLMQASQLDFISNVKLLTYVRERSRILLLSEVLISKSALIEGNVS